jgi:hypothetical protein
MTRDQEIKHLRCVNAAYVVASRTQRARDVRDWKEKERLLRRIEKLRTALERIGGHDATEALSRDIAIARRQAI